MNNEVDLREKSNKVNDVIDDDLDTTYCVHIENGIMKRLTKPGGSVTPFICLANNQVHFFFKKK